MANQKFIPKRVIRSFRDLEIYQRSSKASVDTMKKIIPFIGDGFPIKDEMTRCCLSIPTQIAEAHSRRFEGKEDALRLLEESMVGCNRMVVYLEQVRDILSPEIDKVMCEDLIKGYQKTRIKIFNLQRAWKGDWKP